VKERTRLSSGNMLLLELLFALIFFSLSLSVTLSVFGQAYVLSKKAEGKDLAVAETNDVAEIIRSARSVSEIDSLLTARGLSADEGGRYLLSYGDDKYNMIVTTSLSGKLYTADIACYDSNNASDPAAIYELKVEHAVKDEAAKEGENGR